jgi:hypothetical protein
LLVSLDCENQLTPRSDQEDLEVPPGGVRQHASVGVRSCCYTDAADEFAIYFPVFRRLAKGRYTPEATAWVKVKSRAYSQAEGREDFFEGNEQARRFWKYLPCHRTHR